MLDWRITKIINEILADRQINNEYFFTRFYFFAIVLLCCFSILGLVWSVPVPHINSLGKLNGYINLATVLIVIIMLLAIRKSLKVAFLTGITICIFSAGIITLEKLNSNYEWPKMGMVCSILFVASSTGLFLLTRKKAT